jgi:Ca2+-binding EF-hand superfamily protein
MLSDQTIDILKAFFIAIADHELSIEKQRQYLSRLEEFEPYATFIRLDRNNNGFITAYEVQKFLQDNELDEVSLEECEYLIKFFDSDKDDVLNYTDYMQMVITCDDTYLRAAVTQRDPYGVNPNEYLSPILERELAILFEKELAYHKEIEIIKRDLQNAPDFSIEAAFEEIDQDDANIIDHISVESFLRRNGFAPTEEELTAIIRRIDVSADASASFAEFEEALQPVEIDTADVNNNDYNNQYSKGGISYRGTHESAKLANPSLVKLENLRTGYYDVTYSDNQKKQSAGSSHSSQHASQKMGNSKKKYDASEMPISPSYYQQKS